MPHSDALMSGVRVVELGSGIAGSVLGKLMADHGAIVTKIPYDRDSATGDMEDAFAIWDIDKAVASSLEDVHLEADLVIDHTWCGPREEIDAWLHRNAPGTIVCTFTSGLEEEPSGISARDLEGLVCAHAGMYESVALVDGKIEESVAFIDLPVASVCSAIQGLVACAGALNERARTGAGARVSISLSTAPSHAKGIQHVNTSYGEGIIPDPGTGLSGLYQAGDGRWLILSVPSHRLAARLLSVIRQAEHPTEGLEPLDKLMAHLTVVEVAQVRTSLQVLLQSHSADYWEEVISGKGVPCVKCRTPSEWLDVAHARDSGLFREVELPGKGTALVVGPVVSVQ